MLDIHIWHRLLRVTTDKEIMKEKKLLVDHEVCKLRRRDWALALGKQREQRLNDRIWPFGIYRNSSYTELKFPSGTEMKELGAGEKGNRGSWAPLAIS